MDIFFPSCNFTKASPEAARRLMEAMRERMPAAGCCRVDKTTYPEGGRALYLCQACRETIEMRFPQLQPENIFVWLDRESPFPLPDHSGLRVSVQNCWRDRDHPEIHAAVRSLLLKMGVSYAEPADSRERSRYCGNLHFEPEGAEARELIAARPETELFRFPEDEQRRIFAEQVERHQGLPALCYCNRCKLCLEQAGGKAVHLMELIMGESGE